MNVRRDKVGVLRAVWEKFDWEKKYGLMNKLMGLTEKLKFCLYRFKKIKKKQKKNK